MKKLYKLFVCAISAILFIVLQPHTILAQSATALNKKTETEHYFFFQAETRQQVNTISRIISIDNVIRLKDGFLVYAYANNRELNSFEAFQIPYTELEHPARKIPVKMLEKDQVQNIKSTNAWDFYPTYDAYVTMMYQFQNTFPELCEVYNLGQTPNNHAILYAKISANVDQDEAEPRFNYTSSMHGDELTGYILMLRLIDHLLTNYGSDAEVTTLLDSMEIWINPLANPDGTFMGGNNTVNGAIRYNANYVDINRNFPDFDDGPHPDGNSWQTETQIFMGFADTMDFVMAANFHGGAEVVNYPWDTEIALHPDNTWWVGISQAYADTVHANAVTGYLTDLNNGITNGYAWYTITGGRQDYMNYYHRTRELTIELSSVKTPAPSALPSFWTYNFRSLMNFMKEAQWGIRGFVTDSLTGDPLVANVYIAGHDNLNTDVYSHLPHGDYYRPIAAGNWTVTFSCPGYQSKTIQNVSVVNGAATYLDVQLVAIAPVVAFDAENYSSCTGEIQFIDLTNTSPGSTYLWDFGDGTSSTEINPVHEYMIDGTYSVTLTVSNSIGTSSYTFPNMITIDRPDVPQIYPDSICGAGAVTLQATGTDSIYWYSNLQSDSVIFSGNTLFIPFLDSSASYYVQNVQANPVQSAGKTDNSGSGGYYMNSTSHYLVFDAYSDFILESVKVYANYSGNRIIQLADNQGNIIQQADVFIATGEQTITLNFTVPAGNNLQLKGPAAPGLYRNNSGLNYPYTLPGVLSITGSSASSNPTGYYYYFYDWQVKQPDCYSAKIEITASVLNDPPTPDFSFTVMSDSVEFINLSTEASSYFWDFGDGAVSTEINPVHQYTATGLYNVWLQSTNVCGSDSISKQVSVIVTNLIEANQNHNIMVYPNPATEMIQVVLPSPEVNRITILNVNGQVVSIPEITEDKLQLISVGNLPAGVYYLSIQTQGNLFKAKFLKL